MHLGAYRGTDRWCACAIGGGAFGESGKDCVSKQNPVDRRHARGGGTRGRHQGFPQELLSERTVEQNHALNVVVRREVRFKFGLVISASGSFGVVLLRPSYEFVWQLFTEGDLWSHRSAVHRRAARDGKF